MLVERFVPDECCGLGGLANNAFGFLKLRPVENLLERFLGVTERCQGSAMLLVVLVFEYVEADIVECEFSEFSAEWPMYWEQDGVGDSGAVAVGVEQADSCTDWGLKLFCIASSVDDRDLRKNLLILEGVLLGVLGFVSGVTVLEGPLGIASSSSSVLASRGLDARGSAKPICCGTFEAVAPDMAFGSNGVGYWTRTAVNNDFADVRVLLIEPVIVKD